MPLPGPAIWKYTYILKNTVSISSLNCTTGPYKSDMYSINLGDLFISIVVLEQIVWIHMSHEEREIQPIVKVFEESSSLKHTPQILVLLS